MECQISFLTMARLPTLARHSGPTHSEKTGQIWNNKWLRSQDSGLPPEACGEGPPPIDGFKYFVIPVVSRDNDCFATLVSRSKDLYISWAFTHNIKWKKKRHAGQSWVRELRSCPEPRSGSGTAVAERQITQSALMISPWRTAN